MKKFIIFAVSVIMCFVFSGREPDGYKAFMSIENGTRTSRSRKYDFLTEQKAMFLILGKKSRKWLSKLLPKREALI